MKIKKPKQTLFRCAECGFITPAKYGRLNAKLGAGAIAGSGWNLIDSGSLGNRLSQDKKGSGQLNSPMV